MFVISPEVCYNGCGQGRGDAAHRKGGYSMRLRATFYDEALKLYPLAVFINVIGVLLVPGMFCLFRFGLLLTSLR